MWFLEEAFYLGINGAGMGIFLFSILKLIFQIPQQESDGRVTPIAMMTMGIGLMVIGISIKIMFH